MSDFADGIAPQRYPCRRITNCNQRKHCNPTQNSSWPTANGIVGATHWSLDEGRWTDPGVGSIHPAIAIPPPPPEHNAFIGFKRFVDSKLDRFTCSPTVRAQVEAEGPSNGDAWSRWTGRSQQPEVTANGAPSSEAKEAARLLLRQAELSTLDVPSHAIRALFQEDPPDYATRPDSIANAMLAFGGACYFLPEIGDRLPSSKSLFRPTPLPHRWLSIEWFQYSPYSPVNVETDSNLPASSGRWRLAFDDLMAAALDRPVQSSSPPEPRVFGYEHIPPPLEPGVDWVLGLQLRGILPPLLPRLLSEQSPRSPRLNFERGKKDFDRLVNTIELSNRATMVLRAFQEATEPFSQTSMSGTHDLKRVLHSPSLSTSDKVGPRRRDLRLDSWTEHTRPAAESNPDIRLSGDSNEISKSAVLRTVQTTSKTTRTMDGKVSTRTLVRRQYDDGTEEEWETIHSSNDNSSTPAC